jgi:hypothetical protein
LKATTWVGLRSKALYQYRDFARGKRDSLGIPSDNPQRRRGVYTPVQQEPALVIRHVPPLRRMVLFPARDVDDHLQIPKENRAKGAGTVGEQVGGADDSRFMGKVLDKSG